MAQQGHANSCRVCLKSENLQKNEFRSLFQEYNNSLISDHINSIADVEIKKNDELPTKICPDCWIELEAALNFKWKCEKSNTLLHRKEKFQGDNVKVEFYINDIKKEELEDFEYNNEVEYLEEDILDDTYAGFISEEKPIKAIDYTKLICHDCGGSFPSKCKLRVHWKKTHLPEHLLCQTCKRLFKSYKALHRHKKHNFKTCISMKNVQIQGTGKSRMYLCKDCPYKSRRNKDILSHLVVHTGERPVKCKMCDKTFTQISSMQMHMERAHGKYKVEITCQYCGKHIRGRQAVYSHLQIHTSTRIQCDVCKKVYSSKKSLQTHMIRHTGVKSYTCEKCAKTFFTLAELCNHRRVRHNKVEIWYKCDLCEYKSHRRYAIKNHQTKHKEDNVPCNVCGVFLENAEKLAQHMPRHLESEKKFHCPHCDRNFFRKESVYKHIKAKHTCASLNSPVKVKKELDETRNCSQKTTP